MSQPPGNQSGSDARPKGDYEVGYGKPPIHSRFKPGGVGNPKGRRKATTSVGQMLEDALMKKVTVEENGRSKTMTAQEYILRNLVRAAARGDHKSIQLLFNLRDRYRDSAQAVLELAELGQDDREIIETYLATLPARGLGPSPTDKAGTTPATEETADSAAISKLPDSKDDQT